MPPAGPLRSAARTAGLPSAASEPSLTRGETKATFPRPRSFFRLPEDTGANAPADARPSRPGCSSPLRRDAPRSRPPEPQLREEPRPRTAPHLPAPLGFVPQRGARIRARLPTAASAELAAALRTHGRPFSIFNLVFQRFKSHPPGAALHSEFS